MSILALDLGTKTGWAVSTAHSGIISGTHKNRTSAKDHKGVVWNRFYYFLDAMNDRHQISLIVYEDVMNHAGVLAAHAYGGYLAILEKFAADKLITIEGVGVGTIKKHATGRGNAKKEEMIAAMTAKGYNPSDDNEADALALLHLVLERETL